MGSAQIDDTEWLTASQQRAWRKLVALITRLPAALDTQLQRDSALTHFDYSVLAELSEAPERRLRLSELAQLSNASLSRLSHVVTKLETPDGCAAGACPARAARTRCSPRPA